MNTWLSAIKMEPFIRPCYSWRGEESLSIWDLPIFLKRGTQNTRKCYEMSPQRANFNVKVLVELKEPRNPKVTWKFLEKNVPIFNPITNKCRLCLREKFNIILRPSEATLNSRQEIFAHCKHLQSELICVAPD